MTDNEKIARWRGYIYVDQRIKQPFPTDGISGWRDGLHGKDVSIAFDTDIALWHGEEGLLATIEKLEMSSLFIMRGPWWIEEIRATNEWSLLTATPAQLTAALVKVIDDDNR